MLGEIIDHHILRFICHDRNIKTEEKLDVEINFQSNISSDENFNKFIDRSRNYFDWREEKILEVGCGKGDLARSLAKNGAKEVWGVDIQQNLNFDWSKEPHRNGIMNYIIK